MTKRKFFGISKDLSEGISQTINAVKNNAGQLRYEIIPLSRLKFDPNNPRKLTIEREEILKGISKKDPLYESKKKELESLNSLAASIKKSGVRHAIEVYKDGLDYRLISGERRVLGALLAGKEDIQARVLDNKPSEFDLRYLQWIENIEREDLTVKEKMYNVRQLVEAYTHIHTTPVTATILKEVLGCTLSHAMTFLAIIQAPEDVRYAVENNQITSLEKAALLAKIEDDALRNKLLNACVEGESLSKLKLMVQQSDKIHIMRKKETLSQVKQKPGRQPNRVSLGYTGNIPVIKCLFQCVLQSADYTSYQSHFENINWASFSDVSKAFQRLIRLMEIKEI